MSAFSLRGNSAMPFHPPVTKFALGNRCARLLIILPQDRWLGLIEFDGGQREWVNAAQLAAIGWVAVVR
jgi:hypothetical protein